MWGQDMDWGDMRTQRRVQGALSIPHPPPQSSCVQPLISVTPGPCAHPAVWPPALISLTTGRLWDTF